MSLRDLQVGEVVRTQVGVLESAIKQASNGPYLMLKVSDVKSTITCKQWSYNKAEIPEVGEVIEIRGTVGEFKGVKDINLMMWKSVPGNDISQFRKRSDKSIEYYWEGLQDFATAITKESIYEAVTGIYNKYADRLKYVPAAVGCHHDSHGGLLQHLYEVTKTAIKMAEIYKDIMKIDLDYIIAGAMLHDIGKVICYDFEGIAPVMTQKGKFSDHIVYGPIMISEFIDDEHLIHIVAAHHGKKEYGSPVVPCSVEAFIVSQADETSAKVHVFKEEMEQGTGWNDRKNFYVDTRVWRGEE